jgi:hypothetical protein
VGEGARIFQKASPEECSSQEALSFLGSFFLRKLFAYKKLRFLPAKS